MGSPIYDFLLDSFLFDEDRIADCFRSESDHEIERELDRYRDYCVAKAPEMEQEVRGHPSVLKMVAPTGGTPIDLLKQAGLYVEQFIVEDPLFRVGYRPSPQAEAASKLMGFEDRGLNRGEVVQAIRHLKQITPMVAVNYVKVLPFSFLFEPPAQVPLRWPVADQAVPEVIRWLSEEAKVHPLEAKNGRLLVLPAKPGLAPRERIGITFGEDAAVFTFQYAQMHGVETDDDTRTFRSLLRPEIPNRRTFEVWKRQSIGSAAEDYHRRIGTAARVAGALRAAQMVQSPLAFELLERVYGVHRTLETEVADALMQMNLPFLEGLSAEAIMSVRRDYAEAFSNFRVELEKQLRDFALMEDQQAIAKRAREVAHELGTVQVHALENELKNVREKTIFKPAGVGLATLVVSALLANPLVGAAGALGTLGVAASALVERRATRRKHPAFFLWEAQKRSRRERLAR